MFSNILKEGVITADPNKISRGTVFVDISHNRKNNIIYEAYNKGASLIFTSKNVSDPELPVIKVREANDTLFLLLDKYYNKPQEKIKLIAIGGNSQKEVVADIVNKMFLSGIDEHFYNKGHARHDIVCSSDLESLFISMQHNLNSGAAIMPVVLDLMSSNSYNISGLSFDCGILTSFEYSDLYSNTSQQLQALLSAYSNVPAGKPILINIDEQLSLDFVSQNKSAIIITYGLNKKSAVTATSIDINEALSFNYCLQRTIKTRNGNTIEPFEMPIKLKLSGEDSIYIALAAITCCLYYDFDILQIKKVIENYYGYKRRFQTIHKSKFTIIDNYCCLPSDYNAVFRTVQSLSFNKLRPVISICSGLKPGYYEQSAKNILEWCKILNIDEVIITEALLDKDTKNLIPYRILKSYKRVFEDNNISLKHYRTFKASTEYAIKCAKENDIVLMLGGKEMELALDKIFNQMRLN